MEFFIRYLQPLEKTLFSSDVFPCSNVHFWNIGLGRRKVWKSGGHVVLGVDNVPLLVEIELTDLPITGGATFPPAPLLVTGL